jgi:hypothetical protein
MTEPAIGDLVWASPHGLMDPDHVWAVGIVIGWIRDQTPQRNKHYLIGPKLGKPAWFKFGFPHAQKVTKAEARRIVRTLRRTRTGRPTIGDQVWRYLIEEHKKATQASTASIAGSK